MDSTALVERLLNELIKATQSYNQIRKQLEKKEREHSTHSTEPLLQQNRLLEKELARKDEALADLKRALAEHSNQKPPLLDSALRDSRDRDRDSSRDREADRLRRELEEQRLAVQVLERRAADIDRYEEKFEEMQEQILVLRTENDRYGKRMVSLQAQLEQTQDLSK